MTVTVTSPPTTSPPDKYGGDPVAFDAAMQAHLGWQTSAIAQLNSQNAENNTINSNVNTQSLLTSTASAAAVSAANFKGNWASLTGALNVPSSVYHGGMLWQLLSNLSNVTAAEPGSSASWYPLTALERASRASIAPTLDLDFAAQRYRVFDGAVGLKETALADILTYTGSGRTYTDALGILQAQASNTPRIGFDPVTGAGLGLSVWAARTNLLTYSEQFDNAAWTKTETTVTANGTTAPDGTLTAEKIVPTVANSTHICFQNASVTSGTVYAQTFYAKAAEFTVLNFYGSSGFDSAHYINFNLSAGAVGSSSGFTGSITHVGNGWYRCTLIATATSTTSGRVGFRASGIERTAGSSYTGDGTSGLFVWGAQFEVAAQASPYIPTTTAAVTAPADIPSITGSNFSKWFNPLEGTFVALFVPQTVSEYCSVFAASNNTTNEVIRAYVWNNGSTRPLLIEDGGVSQVSLSGASASAGVQYRIASAYKENDFATSALGGTVQTDSAGTLPTVDRLFIGVGANANAHWMTGNIARILYFPRRLANAELQALSA